MDNTVTPEKLDIYGLMAGKSPYPFMVITLGAHGDGWEAHTSTVNSDAELDEFLGNVAASSVAREALKLLHPVRWSNYYMMVPVKPDFFELHIPFDA